MSTHKATLEPSLEAAVSVAHSAEILCTDMLLYPAHSVFSLLLKHHILHKRNIPGNSLPPYRNYAAIQISGL